MLKRIADKTPMRRQNTTMTAWDKRRIWAPVASGLMYSR